MGLDDSIAVIEPKARKSAPKSDATPITLPPQPEAEQRVSDALSSFSITTYDITDADMSAAIQLPDPNAAAVQDLGRILEQQPSLSALEVETPTMPGSGELRKMSYADRAKLFDEYNHKLESIQNVEKHVEFLRESYQLVREAVQEAASGGLTAGTPARMNNLNARFSRALEGMNDTLDMKDLIQGAGVTYAQVQACRDEMKAIDESVKGLNEIVRRLVPKGTEQTFENDNRVVLNLNIPEPAGNPNQQDLRTAKPADIEAFYKEVESKTAAYVPAISKLGEHYDNVEEYARLGREAAESLRTSTEALNEHKNMGRWGYFWSQSGIGAKIVVLFGGYSRRLESLQAEVADYQHSCEGLADLSDRAVKALKEADQQRVNAHEVIAENYLGREFTNIRGKTPEILYLCSLPKHAPGTDFNLSSVIEKLNRTQMPEGTTLDESSRQHIRLTRGAEEDAHTLEIRRHKHTGRSTFYVDGQKIGSAWNTDAYRLAMKFAEGKELPKGGPARPIDMVVCGIGPVRKPVVLSTTQAQA